AFNVVAQHAAPLQKRLPDRAYCESQGHDISCLLAPTIIQQMAKLTIAIDGPAGSGKSSVARRVAAMLGYLYLDSGAMYRAVALKALQNRIPLEDDARLEELARESHIELKSPTPEQESAGLKNRVFLDSREVTYEIRSGEVAQAASRLATIA